MGDIRQVNWYFHHFFLLKLYGGDAYKNVAPIERGSREFHDAGRQELFDHLHGKLGLRVMSLIQDHQRPVHSDDVCEGFCHKSRFVLGQVHTGNIPEMFHKPPVLFMHFESFLILPAHGGKCGNDNAEIFGNIGWLDTPRLHDVHHTHAGEKKRIQCFPVRMISVP